MRPLYKFFSVFIMGHRDNFIRSLGHFLLFLFFIVSLFTEEIQSVQKFSSSGNYDAGSSESAHGFSKVRRVSARVLHKREFPIDKAYKETEHGNHLDSITIELPLDSSVAVLDLRLNWDLMAHGYFERFQKNGTDILHRPSAETGELCHYQGKIRNKPTSWAAISLCKGISGVLFDGEHLHHLEPALPQNHETGNTIDKPWETLHYKHIDLNRNLTCGHNETEHSFKAKDLSQHSQNLVHDEQVKAAATGLDDGYVLPVTIHPKLMKLKKVKRGVKTDNYREPFNANQKSRYVEMVMVVDNKKFKELGGDLQHTIRRTKEISNIVNALYAPINIFIALVGIVVWTEADEIQISANGDETLAKFLHYRKERLLKDHPNDNAQLITAQEFENGVVGKAMQGPMCSYKFSGGVNSDYKTLTGIVATTIAHELGHGFGLSHDGEECKCPAPNGRCIMSASTSSNRTTQWSSCSLEGFAYAFDHGMDYCLRNKPKRLFDGPTCGNGFVESGEECDPGVGNTENFCCNAETCMLHKNATCGAGSCCDLSTCNVKPGGTTCRPASNTCDLPEYCSGESEYCPEDVYKLSGEECETPNGLAYCYEGRCRTHTDQCRLLWGPSGNNSDNLCYQKNNNGTRYGNCGYNITTDRYKQCNIEDTKCGLLHCKYYHEKLEFGYEPVAQLSSFFVNSQGNVHPCRSVTIDFGTQDVDPGLVPDGAKCGKEKMCVDQKCVTTASIMGSLKCSGGCGSHGTCNSKGHCHCEDGYGGESCSGSGFGGSVDSGPAVDPYATSIFAKSLYVTFLGFIPLIAIISFYIYYANDNIKKLCLRGKAVATRPVNRNNNKPQGNGSVALRTLDISNPTPSGTNSNNNSKTTTPDDFFGKYKGFSLTPLKQSPDQNGTHNVTNTTASSVSEISKNFNNNTSSPTPPSLPPLVSTVRSPINHLRPVNISTGSNGISNGNIQSTTNSNVYYSPVPTQTISECLVKNHNEKPTIKSLTNSFLQKGRVSWAQPVAQPLPTNSPTSPMSETSEPFYDNATAINMNQGDTTDSPHHHISSTTLSNQLNENTEKTMEDQHQQTGNVNFKSKTHSGQQLSGPRQALSRLAGAIPFMRNSLRHFTSSSSTSNTTTTTNTNTNIPVPTEESSSSSHHHTSAIIDTTKNSSTSHSKPSLNRKNLEISTPILQADTNKPVNLQNLISIVPSNTNENNKRNNQNSPPDDENDYANATNNTKKTSKGRYANIPLIDESPVKTANPPPPPLPTTTTTTTEKQWPKNMQLERIKPENKQTERKPVRKAHSMIQPNRNSMHNSNPNYNSLRRTRPSVAPPPPPPPTGTITTPTPPNILPPPQLSPMIQKARSESPPPVSTTKPTVPTAIKSVLRPTVNTSNISSILKFSLGGGRNFTKSSTTSTTSSDNNNSTAPTNNASSTSTTTNNTNNINTSIFSSSSSSKSPKGPAPIAKFENDAQSPTSPPMMNATEGGGGAVDNIYDEIAESKEDTSKVEEKIETLSTGSSESAGGLLSEIIFEIQNRNKESIYNSVDRRRKKRETLAANKEKEQQQKVNANNKNPSFSQTSKNSQQLQQQQQKSNDTITKSHTPQISTTTSSSTVPVVTTPSSTSLFSSYKSSSPRFRYKPNIISNFNTNNKFSTNTNNQTVTSTSQSNTTAAPNTTSTTAPTIFSTLSSGKNNTTTSSSNAATTNNNSGSLKIDTQQTLIKPIIPPPPIVPSSASSSISTSFRGGPYPSSSVVSTPTTSSSAISTNSSSSSINNKPMCAVNGVPKMQPIPAGVTISPSYVAKINYFSNLNGPKTDSPMKPLNSLNSALSDPNKSVVSSIYAPSNISSPEPAHLSTIRPTWSVRANHSDTENHLAGIYSPNSNSDYGTLGKNKGKKILEDMKPPEVKPPLQQQQNEQEQREQQQSPTQQGYKPFNSYLSNRPLTFSTFRPNKSSTNPSTIATTTPGLNNSTMNKSPITSTKVSLSMSNPKPVTVNTCSISTKQPYGMDRVKVNDNVMRSPTRVPT